MTCDTVFLVGGPSDGEWRQLEPGCYELLVVLTHETKTLADMANGYGHYRRPTLFANTMTWDGPDDR